MTKPGTNPARILIVDDHPMVREGLSVRLSSYDEFQVCGEDGTVDGALQLVQQLHPDLVIVDISLQGGDGVELIKTIRARYPRIKMLVFSGFPESVYGERALRAGAMGYVNKQESNGKMISAVRSVLQGELFVSETLSRRLCAQALGAVTDLENPVQRLTDRELEVFRWIGTGKTTVAIAKKLHLSRHTVDTHRENIKRKLGLRNSAELSCRAVQWVLESTTSTIH